jgi:transketolase
VPLSWRPFVGDHGVVVGIDHYGASADQAILFREFGFTPEAVVAATRQAMSA